MPFLGKIFIKCDEYHNALSYTRLIWELWGQNRLPYRFRQKYNEGKISPRQQLEQMKKDSCGSRYVWRRG
jgi:hypothetical protein